MKSNANPAAFGLMLLALLASGSCKPVPEPDTMLTVQFDKGSYRIEAAPFQGGHTLRFLCLEGCPVPVDVSAGHPDSPLGMLSRDNDDLFFLFSSSGSAYWVRVWHLTENGAERVGEIVSRTPPDFAKDDSGHTVIRSYEGDPPEGLLRPMDWKYVDGRYVRSELKVN